MHNYLALAAGGVIAAVRGLAIAGQACMAHDGCNAKLQELTNKAKELVGLGNDDKAANKPARDTSVTQKEADDMRKQGLDPINKDDIKNFQGDKDQNSKDSSNYTKDNFRANLTKLTGENPKDKDAHHVLPQKFEDKFKDSGIQNIHDPKYGSWWSREDHQKNSTQYNKEWEKFLGDKPNKKQVENKAKQLGKDYGFQTNF